MASAARVSPADSSTGLDSPAFAVSAAAASGAFASSAFTCDDAPGVPSVCVEVWDSAGPPACEGCAACEGFAACKGCAAGAAGAASGAADCVGVSFGAGVESVIAHESKRARERCVTMSTQLFRCGSIGAATVPRTPEIMLMQDAARFLGVSRKVLWRWNTLGVGPPRALKGKRYWYAREALKEWLRNGARGLSGALAASPRVDSRARSPCVSSQSPPPGPLVRLR